MRAPAGSRAHLGLWAATPGSGPRRDQHVPCRLLELRCLCDTATRYVPHPLSLGRSPDAQVRASPQTRRRSCCRAGLGRPASRVLSSGREPRQPRHRRGVLRKPEGSTPLRKASTTGQSPWQMGSRGTGRGAHRGTRTYTDHSPLKPT